MFDGSIGTVNANVGLGGGGGVTSGPPWEQELVFNLVATQSQ